MKELGKEENREETWESIGNCGKIFLLKCISRSDNYTSLFRILFRDLYIFLKFTHFEGSGHDLCEGILSARVKCQKASAKLRASKDPSNNKTLSLQLVAKLFGD